MNRVLPALDDCRWLVGAAAAQCCWNAPLLECAGHGLPDAAFVDRLRRGLPAAQTHLALVQVEYRIEVLDWPRLGSCLRYKGSPTSLADLLNSTQPPSHYSNASRRKQRYSDEP